jgi:YHS domain-containing protein
LCLKQKIPMKVKYFAALAVASLISVGTAHLTFNSQIVSANPCAANACASKKPCAANPCAANPCAANPCAANPCAANPCASKNPCAANPCAANPCAANPCAANPCAGKNPCASSKVLESPAPKIYTDIAAGDNLAIRGYDPVAYFTESAPVKGSAAYEYQWKGATWRFSSAENLQRFKENPEAYAPQYGGYCAKALSDGVLASTVPDAWKIVDGKLYLNYSQQAQAEWLADGNPPVEKIEKADGFWPNILNTATFIAYDTAGQVPLQ